MDIAPGRPADTTPEAWEAQLTLLRRMGGSRRVAVAFRLTRLAREASRAGIRARHPEYGEGEVRRAFFRMMHGDSVTRSVWPDRDPLDPVSAEEEAVSRLVRRLEALGIPYMIAGSFASSHHGLPRATNDADIVIDPSPEALDALLAALAAEGYYADARTAREALRARRLFNVIDPETAFKVDLIIRKERPFSREEFARRERRDLGELAASIATAEDTILSKLEWARKAGGSERQLADALGVLQVCGERIDQAYVEKWASALGVVDLWQELVRQVSRDR